MATFFMFGKYSVDATGNIAGTRTEQAAELAKSRGGSIKEVYTLLGVHDLVLIIELPNNAEAMKFSIDLGRLTGIEFSTAPALCVSEFDSLMS